MVWGAFCGDGCLEIQFVSCKMNSTDYVKTLEMSLLPFIAQNPLKNYIFQQDNAAIHNNRFTKNWFSSKNITVLEWPACSPDVNPMENIWGILSNRVYSGNRQYENLNLLKNSICHEWSNIDQNLINTLVESMTSRIFNLIKNKGGLIRK